MDRRKLLGLFAPLGLLGVLVADSEGEPQRGPGRTPSLVPCKDCKFWVRQNGKAGGCYRYPPGAAGWPKTAPEEFCGEGVRKT